MARVHPNLMSCRVCGTDTERARNCYRRNQLVPDERDTFVEDKLWFCGNCGFRWIDPPPPLDKLLEDYSNTPVNHWGDPANGGEGPQRQYAAKVKQILGLKEGGRALDVGCFNGDFLAHLPDSFEKWGVEVSKAAAQHARERGIEVIEADIRDAELPADAFDVVYCSDVFEHLTDQQGLAAILARTLAPGGMLVIETGDCSSPLAKIMGARWYYQSLLEHVCFHTPQSLNLLMDCVQLAPVVTERRWHEQPENLLRPIRRAAVALGYGATMGLLAPLRSLVALPKKAESLYTRTAPRHPWRDHLWHIYTQKDAT